MHLVVRYRIAIKVGLDFGLMVRVVAQRVEHLSKGKMWKMRRNLFRGHPESPQLYNCTHRSPRSLNDWFSAENVLISRNITVVSYDCHFLPPATIQ